ncbi:MAG: STAS domain-containing protein [Candidatus Abawacabacteria bacterium]|nr:STAS domain-containing protein [Candidatus Abawacabacteria bacterium]
MTPFTFVITDIKLNNTAKAKHILCQGELDESNVDFHAETIYDLIHLVPKGTHFVLDGKSLAYLNSKALGYLTDWFNKLDQKGGRIFLVNLKPAIFDVLDVVGITQIISVHDKVADIELN